MQTQIVLLAWFYFSQGIPYGLQSNFLPTYMRTHNSTLTRIGGMKLLLSPWLLKGLWAPLVDRHGTHFRWLSVTKLLMTVSCILLSLINLNWISTVCFVLFILNFSTAVQDIAVDGLAIDMLKDAELGFGNSVQVVGYKFGAVFGGLFMTFSEQWLGWFLTFLLIASIYFLSFILTIAYKSKLTFENTEKMNSSHDAQMATNIGFCKTWIGAYISVMQTPGTIWMLIFLLTYKLGSQGALSLFPLFLIDSGVSSASINIWTGIFGMSSSIFGSVYGGFLLSASKVPFLTSLKHHCLLRLLPLFGMLMLTLYMLPSGLTLSISSVVCIVVLQFHSGAVTTATFTLMMHCSRQSVHHVQNTHYAVLSTVEVLGKLLFSSCVGSVTEFFGYSATFAVLILMTVLIIPLFDFSPKVLQSVLHRDK